MKRIISSFLYNVFFAIIALNITATALGDDRTDEDPNSFDFIPQEWKEAETVIPPLPETGNLLPFNVINSPHRYYIDSKSLSLNKSDNIARYTVVVESRSGTRNILYEGIRCDTGQYKTYAGAINDEPFITVTVPVWRNISSDGEHSFRKDLYRDYLCRNSGFIDTREGILKLFRYSPSHYSNELNMQ